MIAAKIADSLNNQVNAEMYSAYLYLGMSAYATSAGLKGAANWFYVQAQEEMVHAHKFYNYINSQGGRVLLQSIEQPPSDYESLLRAFEDTLAHEKKVTALINGLVDLAAEEGDHATEVFLQWFVTEQVEEEESAKEVVDRLKLAGIDGAGLFMVDNELTARVFAPPPAGQ